MNRRDLFKGLLAGALGIWQAPQLLAATAPPLVTEPESGLALGRILLPAYRWKIDGQRSVVDLDNRALGGLREIIPGNWDTGGFELAAWVAPAQTAAIYAAFREQRPQRFVLPYGQDAAVAFDAYLTELSHTASIESTSMEVAGRVTGAFRFLEARHLQATMEDAR